MLIFCWYHLLLFENVKIVFAYINLRVRVPPHTKYCFLRPKANLQSSPIRYIKFSLSLSPLSQIITTDNSLTNSLTKEAFSRVSLNEAWSSVRNVSAEVTRFHSNTSGSWSERNQQTECRTDRFKVLTSLDPACTLNFSIVHHSTLEMVASYCNLSCSLQ